MIPTHTVYALLDESKTLQYIGCTGDIQARKRAHKKNWPTLHLVSLEQQLTHEEGFSREGELIQKHQPPLNRSHRLSPEQCEIRDQRIAAHLASIRQVTLDPEHVLDLCPLTPAIPTQF